MAIKKEKKPGAGFGVMILKDRKILLGKRHDDLVKASSELSGEGTWTMPGGKLDFLESFEDGARREVMEETGMRLNNLKVICVNNNMTDKAHFVTIGLLSTNFEGEAKVLEPDEITEWKWFKSEELPENLYPPSKNILENFKVGKFYLG